MSHDAQSRSRALGWIRLGVVAALALAIVAGAQAGRLGWSHPIAVALTADGAAILWLFVCSRLAGNSGFVDPHWSLAPIFLSLYYALGGAPGAEPSVVRQIVVVALVGAWGIRLTYNWQRGFGGFGHEDWRYARLRADFGALYWLIELLGIHVFQAALTFLGSLAVYAAVAVGARPFGALDAVATAVTAFAIWLEMTADRELHDFTQADRAPGAVLDTGLWARSRHPNYLGEILFWWGLWIFALAADPAWWWTIVGPLSITLMFLFVSMPMIEQRQHERRAGYAAYAARVPVLVPRPFGRS